MPAPNPIWGLHLAGGVLTAACVRRRDDGSFELLEQVEEDGPPDEIESVRAGLAFLRRKGVRGRAAFVALPDAHGCLITARLPAEDADLAGTELARELYDHTPFEQPEAHIDQREVSGEGRGRTFVVGGVPTRRFKAFVDILGEGDFGLYGLGFAGSALLHGSRALGLVWDETFLLELQRDRAFVYAADGDHVHRYPVPFGGDVLARAAATASGEPLDTLQAALSAPTADARLLPFVQQAVHRLADDVRATIAYHRECHRRTAEGEAAHARARIVPVGRVARAPLVLAALKAVLGADCDDATPSPTTPVTAAPGTHADPRHVGALGAALQGFAEEDDRLALRAPPEDVPELAETGGGKAPLLVAAAVIGALAVALAIGTGNGDDPAGTDPDRTTRPVAGTGDRSTEVEPDLAALITPLEALAHRATLARVLQLAAAVSGGDADGALRRLDLAWEPSPDGGAWTARLSPTDRARFDAAAARARLEGAADPADAPATLSEVETGAVVLRVPAAAAVRVRRESDARASDRLRQVQDLLAVTGEPGLLERTLADRAESAVSPAEPGTSDAGARGYSVLVSPERVPLVLSGLVNGTGPESVQAARVEATDAGVRITVITSHLDGAEVPDALLDLPLTAATEQDLDAQIARCAPSPLLLTFRAGGPDEDETSDPAALAARPREDGTVTLHLPPGEGALSRRALPDGPWIDVPRPDGGRQVVDDRVPGPGNYVWRFQPAGGEASTVERRVEIPCAVVPLAGDTPAWAIAREGRPTFRLDRSFGGRAVSAVSEPLSPGARITALLDLGEGGSVVLDSGHVFESVERTEQVTERVRRVPVFTPEGRLERDENGAVLTVERNVLEAETVFRVRLRSPSGESLTRAFEK